MAACLLRCWCLAEAVAGGSCAEAKLCCPGRDSSCVVQKTAAVADSAGEKPCYCDHACVKLADCCSDFKKTCNGKSTRRLLPTRTYE